eukprot:736422_1
MYWPEVETCLWLLYVLVWVVVHIFPLCYWTLLSIFCVQHLSGGLNITALYNVTITKLVIMQTVQWMGPLHTFMKWVFRSGRNKGVFPHICKVNPSDIFFLLAQLTSRYNTLMCCLVVGHQWEWGMYKGSSIVSAEIFSNRLNWGYILLILAWSLPHTVRYPFYFCKLAGIRLGLKSTLGWIENNIFVIIIPMAAVAEMKCWFSLIQFLSEKENVNNINVNYPLVPGVFAFRSWAMFSFVTVPITACYLWYKWVNARKIYNET